MISVIIPVYNEEQSIRSTIAYLYAHASYKRLLKEVIVVDGGSTDRTVAEAQKTGATVITCSQNGRVALLDYGARQATGKILYFLHAHSLPPENFVKEIIKACSKGYACGTFSLQFNYKHWLLNTLSWLTKHNSNFHLSAQSLFVTKELFDKSGGFRTDHYVLANQEMIRRLKRYTNFIVIKDSIVASAGKYIRHGIFRTEVVHVLAFFMNKMGCRQQTITKLYRTWLGWKLGTTKHEQFSPAEETFQTEVAS
jgi:rSAM/selenodomain-associated transferase 2